MIFVRFTLLIVVFIISLTTFIQSLPVYPLDYNTIPGQPPYYPTNYNQYPYNNAYQSNAISYDPDGKWPAYGWDAPGNYHQAGKLNSDAWLMPSNIPRYYNQPDGGRGLQGTQGYLWPLFYGKR